MKLVLGCLLVVGLVSAAPSKQARREQVIESCLDAAEECSASLRVLADINDCLVRTGRQAADADPATDIGCMNAGELEKVASQLQQMQETLKKVSSQCQSQLKSLADLTQKRHSETK